MIGKGLAGRVRSRRFALASALGLAAIAGWLALWSWSSSRWLEVDPVPGPLPRGSLIASFQRDFPTYLAAPGGGQSYAPAPGRIARIEPATGAHRDLAEGLALAIRVSPDGRTMAYASDAAILRIGPVGGGEAETIPDLKGGVPCWSPDGSAILATAPLRGTFRGPARIGSEGTWRFAIPGFARTRLDLPDTESVEDWSRDGRWLLTLSSRHITPGRLGDLAIYRMGLDGSGQIRISPPESGTVNTNPRFSPDGRRVAFSRFNFATSLGSIWIVDADGSNPRKLVDSGDHNLRACWSPDGRSLVVKALTQAFLIDADGSNRRPFGLRWRRRPDLFSTVHGMIGIKEPDPRWLGAVEWVDLPGAPGGK